MIRELRVLPPLAIARFGAAPTPMDNYNATTDPERPLGYRHLSPAETLEVDPVSGEIARSFVPGRVVFTENGLVRPVAPFLEVWALTDDELEPLTTQLLADNQASLADLRWRVEVANLKVFRRTGDDDDRVTADSGDITDHDAHPINGTAANFWPGKSIPFGSVRFIRPTPQHPEIRLRFTPGPGFVYGASRTAPAGPATDPECARHRVRREPRRLGRLSRRGPGHHRSRSDLCARPAGGQPRLPRRRLRRPGPGLPYRRRPNSDCLRPDRRRTTGVCPGRAARENGRRRARAGPIRPRLGRRAPSRRRKPRRSSAALSRPCA